MNGDLIAWMYECSKRDSYFGCKNCPFIDDCDEWYYVGLKYDVNLNYLLYIIYAEGEI